VPSFAVVAVGGNIYVDSQVTHLDGLYIAQKVNAAGGKIYDCATGSGSLVSASQMFNTCNKQLVVNGDFVGDQINLMRTYGSLRDSLTNLNENINTSGSRTCNRGSSSVCAAEVFNVTPELYMGRWQLTGSNTGAVQYQSFSSLPPVL
jgi:hypothetical protein